MKTIITTVGVSLFENYQKHNEPITDLGSLEETYSDSEWTYSETLRKDITKKIAASDWIQDNEKASAELQSLLKIKERVGDIRTILVTSDTLKGYFAGDILHTLLNEEFGIPAERPERIEGFDVTLAQGSAQEEEQHKIKTGFDNYIRFLLETSNTYEDSLAGYNISGGFKAMIPISTLIASLKKHPVFYIYEQSDYLIEIPPFPFTYSLDICKPFEHLFQQIELTGEIDERDRIYQDAYTAVKEEERSIDYLLTSKTPEQQHLKTLSLIGEIVWEAYKETSKAMIFTEGKTDWKHLKHAHHQLGLNLNIAFKELEDVVGETRLLAKCKDFAEAPNAQRRIFVFDHDNETIMKDVMEEGKRFKAWGNNVFSFAIPIPQHREGHENISIEFYYTDEEIKTLAKGKRLFLSSEFNQDGWHKEHPDEWRIASHKLFEKDEFKETTEQAKAKIIDYGKGGVLHIQDQKKSQLALSKEEFVEHIREGIPPFDKVNCESFRGIFDVIEEILHTL